MFCLVALPLQLYSSRPLPEDQSSDAQAERQAQQRAAVSLTRLEKTASEVMEAAQAKLKELEKLTERAAAAAKEAEPPTAE